VRQVFIRKLEACATGKSDAGVGARFIAPAKVDNIWA